VSFFIRNQSDTTWRATAQPRFPTATCVSIGFVSMLMVIGNTLLLPLSLFAQSATSLAPQTLVVSKRTKSSIIAMTTSDGRMHGGKNRFCVVFQKTDTKESVDVRNVGVDFTLLVGRIQEAPIKVQLDREQTGNYCGQVDLSKQYYVPASYYAFAHYIDASGKKKRERIFLRVQ